MTTPTISQMLPPQGIGEFFRRIATPKINVRPSRLFRFVHDTMGWHNCRGESKVGFDGVSFEGRCTCGKRVLRDSQGNWFEVEE